MRIALKHSRMIKSGLLIAVANLSVSAYAESPVVELTIHEHRFEPADVKIPANTKIKLLIKNRDASSEEFESYELKREKVITGNSEGVVFIGPLSPGVYSFFGDFNPDSAQGRVIVE